MECAATAGAAIPKGGDLIRGNLRRVTIVLIKGQHTRFKEAARKYHGSLSQFLRLAGENEIRSDGRNDALNLRPIAEKQEITADSVKEIGKKLQRVELGMEFLVNKVGCRIEKVAYDIEDLLLNKNTDLSIPEIGNYLPFEQEEIIEAMEFLEEKFLVKRIEKLNAPSKWIVRGGIRDIEK